MKAEERLIQTAIRVAANSKGDWPRTFSLMTLEIHDGPACGAAGHIVKKWPNEGLVRSAAPFDTGQYRLVRTKLNHATAIRIERV
jgi:hypothetical protein